MPDTKDTQKTLASSKDQLAQLSKLADGITKGAKPPADALKISPQVAGVQGMLGGLKGGPHLNDAKQSVDKAAKSAAALQDEAMKKMPEPVGAAKEALTSLGKDVAAAGAPIKKVSDSLPQLKLPIGQAAGGLTDLKKSAPSAKKLQSPLPDIQGKLAPLQKQIPDAASQLSSPSDTVKGLTGKLKNVVGAAKKAIQAPPLSKALEKAGTADLIKQHLAAAEKKLPQVPPLLEQAQGKLTGAVPLLAQAGAKIGELQTEALAAAPPASNPALDDLKQQIDGAAAAVNHSAEPVDTAAKNLPSAQAKVREAQALISKTSDQMKPVEIKQSIAKVEQLAADAQKQVASPAAGMADSVDATGSIQKQLSSIKDGAAGTLSSAVAAASPKQQPNAAELLGHAQEALNAAPGQMSAAAPDIQKLADRLPQVSSPLARAVQTMHDALTPAEQDLAELQRQLRQAQQQMSDLTQQVNEASQKIDESQKNVKRAAGIDDPAELRKMMDEITAGLPRLDDQKVSDLEKKLPELEALLERIEKSGGGAA